MKYLQSLGFSGTTFEYMNYDVFHGQFFVNLLKLNLSIAIIYFGNALNDVVQFSIINQVDFLHNH